jgi:hypothetical protein
LPGHWQPLVSYSYHIALKRLIERLLLCSLVTVQ